MRYKEYKLGDVFSVESVNKLSIPGKNYIMDKDIIDKNGTVPYIAAISTNNGITGYSSKYEANNKGDCITLSTTADSSNTVFYQENAFIGRQQIAGIRRKDGQYMGHYIGLYIASIIKKITNSFNYSNKLTKDFLRNCIFLNIDSLCNIFSSVLLYCLIAKYTLYPISHSSFHFCTILFYHNIYTTSAKYPTKKRENASLFLISKNGFFFFYIYHQQLLLSFQSFHLSSPQHLE